MNKDLFSEQEYQVQIQEIGGEEFSVTQNFT